jgi:hypothetical protein
MQFSVTTKVIVPVFLSVVVGDRVLEALRVAAG